MTDTIIKSIPPTGDMVQKRANETIVQQLKNGQLVTSIPRAISNMREIEKGDLLEWNIEGDKIVFHKKQG